MSISNQRYDDTIAKIKENYFDIIEEMILLQHIQTTILRNDNYLIKDKDTQAVFESVLSKFKKKIAPNNHQKGYDLMHGKNKVSIKSGIIKTDSDNNKLLKFSYSRTTEFKTLEEKINYLSTFENLILGVASEKIKNDKIDNSSILSHSKYYIYYFPANLINLKKMVWEENENNYSGVDLENNIKVSIVKKMSDQPWISIPTELIPCDLALTVKVVNKNNRKILIIQREDDGSRLYYDIYDHRKKLINMKGMPKKCTKSTTTVAMD